MGEASSGEGDSSRIEGHQIPPRRPTHVTFALRPSPRVELVQVVSVVRREEAF